MGLPWCGFTSLAFSTTAAGVVASPDAPSEGLALALVLADAEGSALVLGAAEGSAEG